MSAYTLPASVNQHNVGAVLAAAVASKAQQVDAAGMQQFDSSALALILELKRRGLSVLQLPARAKELAALYGISDLL